MFGSTVLEIAIGLIFIYLLLSLICSSLNEIVEGWLKNRSVKLEQGLRELLSDPDGTGFVQSLYAHPLINSLFRGAYNPQHMTGTTGFFRRLFGRVYLPSYIPPQNFALALMDIIQPGAAASSTRSAGGMQRSGAAAAMKRAASSPNVVVNLGAVAPSATDDGAMQELRQAVLAVSNTQVRQALITLVDAAGTDVSKARENIETWFNGSMDRVSSWYKRRSQAMILVFAFAVAIAMNADTVYIVRALANDPALRNTLVSAADNYAKLKAAEAEAPSPTPTPLNESQSSAQRAGVVPSAPAPTPTPATVSTPLLANAVTRPSGTPGATPSILACAKDENSPECHFAKTRSEIQKLGLPIGWDSEDDIYRQWPGNSWKRSGGWWHQMYRHWLGWLITALAISLGAPFWFDMLNKFIVIRSTVKPREKSREERSKD
ncbi:MAG: hypothetical protein ABI967_05725 [bacterium]